VPGFLRHDVSASYSTKIYQQTFAFTARVHNVRDIRYWEGFQARGAPRTTSFSLNTRF